MSKVLLDTDILSEIYKGVDDVVSQNALEYLAEHGQLSFSSVSVHEVLYGYHANNAASRAQKFLLVVSAHEEITPSEQDYRLAAEIRAALKRAGTPIGAFDPLIAACAITRGLPLATGNTRHHSHIKRAGFQLTLVNWREPQPS